VTPPEAHQLSDHTSLLCNNRHRSKAKWENDMAFVASHVSMHALCWYPGWRASESEVNWRSELGRHAAAEGPSPNVAVLVK
jgi:hypothetical protein